MSSERNLLRLNQNDRKGGDEPSLDLLKRVKLALSLFITIVITGITGYMVIEGWNFKDAAYMTVTTITTVGFREVRPLDVPGQYFTMFLVLAGVGTAFYLFASVGEFMIEGHLTGLLAVRKVKKEIEKLEGHYILCGYGRVGENVADEFVNTKVPFVVIESNPDRVEACRERGFFCMEGDASSDEVLLSAGVERAQGLVAAVDNDADNVFVTLTARVLNPNINIVARTILEESREKLLRAGANKVVSPSLIGGRRMAAVLLRPIVLDYLDIVTFGDGIEFRLEELIVGPNSNCRGKSIAQADIRRRTGALILAIKKETGEFNTNPTSETILEEGDQVVILGTRNQLDAVKSLF